MAKLPSKRKQSKAASATRLRRELNDSQIVKLEKQLQEAREALEIKEAEAREDLEARDDAKMREEEVEREVEMCLGGIIDKTS